MERLEVSGAVRPIRLNNCSSISYFRQNTNRLNYKGQSVNVVCKHTAIYVKSHTKRLNTLCHQNFDVITATAGAHIWDFFLSPH